MQTKNKKFVIGDIHGGAKALEDLILKINPREGDTFIFLGDYTDGWSESSEVVQYILDLKKSFTVITIMGNHDIWTRDFLVKGKKNPIWLEHGGVSTIESYIKTSYIVDPNHKEFFTDLVDYYIDEENNLFIHAGWNYRYGFPAGALVDFSSGLKECHMNRSLLEDLLLDDPPKLLLGSLKLFNSIFIGHTPTINFTSQNSKILTPINILNLWIVDTGAGFTGKLSAIDIESKQIYQSDFVKKYYPNERGRN